MVDGSDAPLEKVIDVVLDVLYESSSRSTIAGSPWAQLLARENLL